MYRGTRVCIYRGVLLLGYIGIGVNGHETRQDETRRDNRERERERYGAVQAAA